MKNNKTCLNARLAFNNFKEELAKEMGLPLENNILTNNENFLEKIEEGYAHLGRS